MSVGIKKSGNPNVDNIIHNAAQNKKKKIQNIASDIMNGEIMNGDVVNAPPFLVHLRFH